MWYVLGLGKVCFMTVHALRGCVIFVSILGVFIVTFAVLIGLLSFLESRLIDFGKAVM